MNEEQVIEDPKLANRTHVISDILAEIDNTDSEIEKYQRGIIIETNKMNQCIGLKMGLQLAVQLISRAEDR